MWATVICKGGVAKRGGHMPTIMCECMHIIISGKPSVCARVHILARKNLDAKCVRQSESDSVSFCLVMCVRQCCC